MDHVTEDQSATDRVDYVPSLDCRRCRFGSPSPVGLPDAINWEWLEAVLNTESPLTTSTGNTKTALMTTIDPSVSSCSFLTNAQKLVASETSQTENPVLVDSEMQTTVVQRSTRGSQTPCLSGLMMPPDLQIPQAARLLLGRPEVSCQELALQASIAAGGLPEERISVIQLVLEAISNGQCQVIRLVQEHLAAARRMEPRTADIANDACLRQLQMLLSRPMGCNGGSNVPPLDLQTLPATDIEIIDARSVLIGQQVGLSHQSELPSRDSDDAESIEQYISTPASPDFDIESIASMSEDFDQELWN
jgi:hypothetical protein